MKNRKFNPGDTQITIKDHETGESLFKGKYNTKSDKSLSDIKCFNRTNIERFNEMKGKVVRHFKGDLYLVIGIATHSETGDTLVIYKALYGNFKMYARPFSMFMEEVPEEKVNPTGQKYRFELADIKSVKED